MLKRFVVLGFVLGSVFFCFGMQEQSEWLRKQDLIEKIEEQLKNSQLVRSMAFVRDVISRVDKGYLLLKKEMKEPQLSDAKERYEKIKADLEKVLPEGKPDLNARFVSQNSVANLEALLVRLKGFETGCVNAIKELIFGYLNQVENDFKQENELLGKGMTLSNEKEDKIFYEEAAASFMKRGTVVNGLGGIRAKLKKITSLENFESSVATLVETVIDPLIFSIRQDVVLKRLQRASLKKEIETEAKRADVESVILFAAGLLKSFVDRYASFKKEIEKDWLSVADKKYEEIRERLLFITPILKNIRLAREKDSQMPVDEMQRTLAIVKSLNSSVITEVKNLISLCIKEIKKDEAAAMAIIKQPIVLLEHLFLEEGEDFVKKTGSYISAETQEAFKERQKKSSTLEKTEEVLSAIALLNDFERQKDSMVQIMLDSIASHVMLKKLTREAFLTKKKMLKEEILNVMSFWKKEGEGQLTGTEGFPKAYKQFEESIDRAVTTREPGDLKLIRLERILKVCVDAKETKNYKWSEIFKDIADQADSPWWGEKKK